jgi:probable F420-dependent oxidoreductase
MRAYLDAMDEAANGYRAVKPPIPPRVLAALGPKMLDLAATPGRQRHTYLVTPEHTAKARTQLGASRWLAVEQAVVLETDPATARAIGRRHVARYLDLPNYTNNLRRLGFTSEDTAYPGSDRLVDHLVRQAPITSAFRCSTLTLTTCLLGSGGRLRTSRPVAWRPARLPGLEPRSKR